MRNALPATLTSKSHLPTEQQIALENAVEAIIGLFWLASDLSAGEFECGEDHCDREVDTLDDAFEAIIGLAGRTISRCNTASETCQLKDAFRSRLRHNRTNFTRDGQ